MGRWAATRLGLPRGLGLRGLGLRGLGLRGLGLRGLGLRGLGLRGLGLRGLGVLGLGVRGLALGGFLTGGLAYTPGAEAHIVLSHPIARYPIVGFETGMKGCPCGMATGGGNSNRTCNVDKDGSDPNRDESRAFTAEAGSKLVVEFDETVGHAGKFRIAFDPDGADFYDFNQHVLVEVDDPAGNTGNAGGTKWQIEVTLPDTPCDNCTLQLIQVMEPSTLGGTVDGSKLANMSTYYTCVDLVLTGQAPSTSDVPDGETSDNDTSGDGDGNSWDEVTSNDGAPTGPAGSTSPVVSQPTAPTPSSTLPGPTDGTTAAPTGPSPAVPSPGVPSPAGSSTAPSPDEGMGAPGPAVPSGETGAPPSSTDAGGCSMSPRRGSSGGVLGLGMFAAALFVRRRRGG
jgi:hypothetical protein